MHYRNETTLAQSLARMTHALKNEAAYQRVRLALFKLRDAVVEEKYRPDQPRAPKGTPEGGQWIVDPASARQRRLSNERVTVAQHGSSIYELDLREEDKKGGHGFERHVGHDPEWLVRELEKTYKSLGVVNNTRWVRMQEAWGSFSSLQEANFFVRQTLLSSMPIVDKVASGKLEKATITLRFGYATGIEAYWPSLEPPPKTRPTYRVKVILYHKPGDPRGYFIRTAFPYNEDSVRVRVE